MSDVKLVAVTFASNRDEPGLLKLTRTMLGWGWDFRPIIGKWEGFASKLRGVHSELPKLAAEGVTHVLFTDAYDSVCVGPPALVESCCWNKMWVSCEKACWPDASLASQYPSSPRSAWCHINSGGYVGPISLLYDVLLNATGDDQLWLTKKFLEDRNANPSLMRILRDDRCELFQTIGHTVLPWATWDVTFEKIDRNMIRNKVTGTTPLFIHGNGRATMDWLDDHLKFSSVDEAQKLLGISVSVQVEKETPVEPPVQVSDNSPMTWEQIPGFGDHDFAGFYERLVAEAPRGAVIVEVGCYHGRSLAQLALCASKSGKDITIMGVDHSKGQSDQLAPLLLKNLERCGFPADHWVIEEGKFKTVVFHPAESGKQKVIFVEADSVEAASLFINETFWCVFLDDGHLHEEVARGIDAWMPKVTKDGVLAGHDARWHSVAQPIHAKLSDVVHDMTWDNCWFCRKQVPKKTEEVDIFKHFDPPSWYAQSTSMRNDGGKSGTILKSK